MATDKMVSVNKECLIWARNYYDLSIGTVSKETKISVETLQKFEEGTDFPSYAQLEKLSSTYKQPLFLFFLKAPPSQSIKKIAYRSNFEDPSNLSKRTKEMIEQANIYKLNLEKLYKNETRTSFEKLLKKDGVTPKNLNDWFRIKLDLSIEKQKDFKNADTLLKYLREKLFEIGIFVFKDAFKDEDVAGLCLYDTDYPVVLLNNKTTFNRQVFTLFHEIYHIYLQETDIDFTNESEEKECNTFSSYFLIPKDDFDKQTKNIKEYNEDIISELATEYCVSKNAIAYRLLKEKKIDFGLYSLCGNKSNHIRESSSSSGGHFYFTRINYLGENYIHKIFDSYYAGKISKPEVGLFTNLKPVNVSKLASYVIGGEL